MKNGGYLEMCTDHQYFHSQIDKFLVPLSNYFSMDIMNFIADHEAICLCIRWTALPNFVTVWSTMAIDMSNERSQRDLSAKIKFKFSQIKNKLYN